MVKFPLVPPLKSSLLFWILVLLTCGFPELLATLCPVWSTKSITPRSLLLTLTLVSPSPSNTVLVPSRVLLLLKPLLWLVYKLRTFPSLTLTNSLWTSKTPSSTVSWVSLTNNSPTLVTSLSSMNWLLKV